MERHWRRIIRTPDRSALVRRRRARMDRNRLGGQRYAHNMRWLAHGRDRLRSDWLLLLLRALRFSRLLPFVLACVCIRAAYVRSFLFSFRDVVHFGSSVVRETKRGYSLCKSASCSDQWHYEVDLVLAVKMDRTLRMWMRHTGRVASPVSCRHRHAVRHSRPVITSSSCSGMVKREEFHSGWLRTAGAMDGTQNAHRTAPHSMRIVQRSCSITSL
jgi:hypothetical protein